LGGLGQNVQPHRESEKEAVVEREGKIRIQLDRLILTQSKLRIENTKE